MLTLDNAIKHCEEKAKELRQEAEDKYFPIIEDAEKTDCLECAEEHEQLAEWLKELKQLRNSVEIISDIPDDYFYDTETEDFLVYRHRYTGEEIHILKPVKTYRLKDEEAENDT